MKKSGIYFFFVTFVHTNKDNCDRKSDEKNVKVSILYDCMKDKSVRSQTIL